MALDTEQSKISGFGCTEGLVNWSHCFLVSSTRDAGMERSNRRQPSVFLHPPASAPRAGKRTLTGKMATPKLTTWIIFLNRLGTDLGWLKSDMRSVGCECGVGTAPQLMDLRDIPRLRSASGHGWKQNRLFRGKDTPFRLGSHTGGPASIPAGSSGLGDVVSQPHAPPSIREGQLGRQRPSHRQRWG